MTKFTVVLKITIKAEDKQSATHMIENWMDVAEENQMLPADGYCDFIEVKEKEIED